MLNITASRKWFTHHVADSRSNSQIPAIYIDWYEKHTLNVCEHIVNICESLSLTHSEKNIAETIALFHDLASFEQLWEYRHKQLARYPSVSLKRADTEQLFSSCTEREHEIIKKAIAFHNLKTLPILDDTEILFYTRLIRDADKLDLWRQMAEYCKQKNDSIYQLIWPQLANTSEMSDIILKTINENATVLFTNVKTLNDFKLLQISWIFDLNFTESFRQLKKNSFIETILSDLSQKKDVKSIYETLEAYIDDNAAMPVRNDFDSPWKEIIEKYFESFMQFFYPEIASDIDWEKGYESLDKELMQITREARVGGRLADKLMKVRKKSGEDTWVLVHAEIQGQKENAFGHRSFVYNYRAFELYKKPVVSLAILADDNAKWRPTAYYREIWGCKTAFHFNTVKLLDYKNKSHLLETSSNPFAVVVQSHLKSIETKKNNKKRFYWKVELTKNLYNKGLTSQEILDLYHFIDWLIALPKNLEDDYHQEIIQYKEESKMRYVTTAERI
ncbi:MAG: HD domain-containing protein, partial [Candidatus Magnetomorum sp.]|nr:HD domain-containing protein [Candidatus Magnetomorum sp.]